MTKHIQYRGYASYKAYKNKIIIRQNITIDLDITNKINRLARKGFYTATQISACGKQIMSNILRKCNGDK